MTKKCKDGTVTFDHKYMTFATNDPEVIMAFQCDDIESFHHINSLKNFEREQKYFLELSHAQIKAGNHKQLLRELSGITTDKVNVKWNKLHTPTVTKCCGSVLWHSAFNEKDGKGFDYCYACKKHITDNIRLAKAKDLKISDREFKETYQMGAK